MKALSLLLLVVALNPVKAQTNPSGLDLMNRRMPGRSFGRDRKTLAPNPFKIPGKRASQYSTQDWGMLIDSTWGPGQPASEQLQIFDSFWSLIDQQWAGFPNTTLNWDSVRNVYRPQIGSGLSRGRFYSLMSRTWLALSELHTFISDLKVDTVYGYYGSFHYQPGYPIISIGAWLGGVFGAATTPLADSTNLVYRVLPGNPLGLQPGDIVLGYEGVPWKHLYRQLLDAGLPVSVQNSWSGSNPTSLTYSFLMAVGYNWGMFDTIDVVKYSTGDTIHLPTAPLTTFDTTYVNIWANDGVPVPGVPMPEGPYRPEAVSWGVVQGTTIGYIYVWDWASTQTRQLFQNAINDLVNIRHAAGLIIDSRMNWGGYLTYAGPGLSQLFNFDPTTNVSKALRFLANDHMSFTIGPTGFGFTPSSLFDRPIALLIGPGSFSTGDFAPLQLSYHPMARLFGKPTNGAYVAGIYSQGSLSDGSWQYRFPRNIMYTTSGGYLIHKGLLPDEEVWLTREGVAQGQDAVVNRAIAWMNGLSYAHTITLSKDTVRSLSDSILVRAKVENPDGHSLIVSAMVTNAQSIVVDSVLLVQAPGDTTWSVFVHSPSVTGQYGISVRTEDVTAGSYRRLPNVARLTVAPSNAVANAEILPADFKVSQNFPNPFNPSTEIKYQLPAQSHVVLTIFDILGKKIETLLDEIEQPGFKSVQFDAKSLASGVYFYQLEATGSERNYLIRKKMMILK